MLSIANPTMIAPVPPDLDVGRLPLISLGISGAVYAVSDAIVIKKPIPLPNCKEQIDVECKIYTRLGQHPSITKFLGVYQGMPLLERLQYPLRKRLWELRDKKELPVSQDVVRWALHICEGLAHVHSRNVLQVDISAANVLLDWEDNAKLSDFAGSSIDGCPPLALPSLHSEHPRWPAAYPTLRSELFALGSTLYEAETTNQPYHDKKDSEILALFQQDIFPDTTKLVLGDLIRKCWFAQYQDTREVVLDIQQVRARLGGTLLASI